MILIGNPKLEQQSKKIFSLLDPHETYDLFIEGTKVSEPMLSCFSFADTIEQLGRGSRPRTRLYIGNCGFILLPCEAWNKADGSETRASVAVMEMLKLLYLDRQLPSWRYYVVAREREWDSPAATAKLLGELMAIGIAVYMANETKLFAFPEAFSDSELDKVRYLDLGILRTHKTGAEREPVVGLSVCGDVARVPEICLAHEEELVAMHLCGLLDPLLGTAHMGFLKDGRLSRSSVVDVLDALTFGNEDFSVAFPGMSDGEVEIGRVYCAELGELFEAGMPYEQYEPLRRRICDCVHLWKTAFDEMGLSLAPEALEDEGHLSSALRTAGESLGIGARIGAYYAGAPISDITAADTNLCDAM